MKINKYLKTGALAAAALALVCSGQRAQAQIGGSGTETYTDLKFTFPTTGPTEAPFNDPTWIYWYNTPGGNTPITTDPTTDSSNPVPGHATGDSGSLMIVTPWGGGYTQNAFFGCFDDNGAYSQNELADLTTYQSINFDILVQPGTVTNSSGNYGSINVGFMGQGNAYETYTSVTIPASASAGWVHMVCPYSQSLIGAGLSRYAEGVLFNQQNYSTPPYPAANSTTTYWLDNIEVVPSTAPPAPPPTMTGPVAAVHGLNTIWTIPGSAGQYNRYQIADTNDGVDGNDSFYDQTQSGGSVTYSWNIAAFPVADTGAQAHFFIVNGADSSTGTTGVIPNQYDTAADYNFQNVMFFTVQSDGAGNGIFNLRWKTNDGGANDQLFSANEPYVSFTNAGLLGTYSVKFTGGNQLTFKAPNGNTMNYTMPAAAAAMFSESHGPSTFLLGSQPNATNYAGGDVVYSSFSRTGNNAFTDNFATDSALNTNDWEILSSANGVVLAPPTSSYWIDWTLPALNYAPVVSASLSSKSFTAVNPIAQLADNGEEWALLPGNVPAGMGFFQVVQRKFSKLVVVLPGQTFTPGVAPGYSGTPTPVDVSETSLGEEDIAVYAVDSSYYPVPGVTDNISVPSSTDGSAVRPTGDLAMAPAAQNANWSVALFNVNSSTGAFYFVDTPGPYTITVQDDTTQPQGSPVIANATSAPVSTY